MGSCLAFLGISMGSGVSRVLLRLRVRTLVDFRVGELVDSVKGGGQNIFDPNIENSTYGHIFDQNIENTPYGHIFDQNIENTTFIVRYGLSYT